MGRAARSHFRTPLPPSVRGPVKVRRRVTVESPEFTQEFMDAVKEATRDAVAQHHAKGNPVYFTDGDGNICEQMPSRPPRKLSDAEIAALL